MSLRYALLDKLSLLRSLLIFDPLIYLYTVELGTVSLSCSLFDRSGRVQHAIARFWSWLILKTIFCPVVISGLERIDAAKGHVYAINHLSALDIPVVYAHLPTQFRIMAKKELFRYPFMGWHLRRSGQIAVDQQNPRNAIRSLGAAIETLRGGMPLVVFPEGGRSATGQIQPFLSGGFYAAIKAGVDVVPMALVGTYEILRMNTFHIRPGRIQLIAGHPISTAGYPARDMDALASRVQQVVEDLYYSHAQVQRPALPEPASEESTR